jgi:TPR repeat protein
MEAERFASAILFLLLALTLQGCGKNKDANLSKTADTTVTNSKPRKGYNVVAEDPKTGITLTQYFDSVPSQSEIEEKFSEYFAKKFNETKVRAERGDAKAQFELGVMYAKGTGVVEDVSEAFNWFLKAAEQGIVGAQAEIGWMYKYGKGTPQNYNESVKWYRKAGEQGDVKAQFTLGTMYKNGDGVKKDVTEAAEWYRLAAIQGDPRSQLALGRLYWSGNFEIGSNNIISNDAGNLKDDVEAVKWFRKAAEQGNASAQHFLATCYFDGDGVPKDYVESYKWLNIALGNGDLSAKRGLSYVEQWMTSEQIAEAQELSREFKPHKEGSGDSISPDNPSASGTGFFITEDGYLISNYHVVKDATKVRVVTSSGIIDAKVIQTDAANDLALLKASGKFSTLPISASRMVRLNEAATPDNVLSSRVASTITGYLNIVRCYQ